MINLIGRHEERVILEDALQSDSAELIAVYGRRRVGKTFLIHAVYEKNLVFEFSGIHEASLNTQLLNFSLAMKRAATSKLHPAVPDNWVEALEALKTYLEPKIKKQKSVLFFDEFPWIQTPKSGFLASFEHFWNTWASLQKNLVVVICGSAATWMIQNIVNNKGGLHNRISRQIRLLPFHLGEVQDYLHSRKINLDHYQLLQLYMVMGGIPQYLKNIKPGESASQIIDRFCFTKDGPLKGEFNNLYRALFDKPDNHIAIIKALANKGKGLTRTEIIKTCKLSSGGATTKLLEELTESGFITPYLPFGKKEKDNIYKLTDEYSLFYLKFMDNAKTTGAGTWLRLANTAANKSWSGYAFEGICLKHSPQIKKALGIAGILTSSSVWRYISTKDAQGTQIDLLIDRTDNCINVCEIKFYNNQFAIDKDYVKALLQKLNIFKEKTGTRKTLFLTMITTYGVKQNDYYTGLVQNEVTMEQLFDKPIVLNII